MAARGGSMAAAKYRQAAIMAAIWAAKRGMCAAAASQRGGGVKASVAA